MDKEGQATFALLAAGATQEQTLHQVNTAHRIDGPIMDLHAALFSVIATNQCSAKCS
jgi:hypothetical protein